MKWQILILTQPSRSAFLVQLLPLLMLPENREVSVRLVKFDPSKSLGENREWARQTAEGEYISFLDDDDFVHPSFVPKILRLLDGVDQVSFDVAIYQNGRSWGIAKHSLAHGNWTQRAGVLYRDISHVHPMRRELALEVPMEGGIGEDYRWATAMRGRVKTEHHIDEALYYYLWRTPKDDTKDQVSPTRLTLLRGLESVRLDA